MWRGPVPIIILSSLWLLVFVFLAVYGTLRHWDYQTILRIALPVGIVFLIALLLMLRLPWWLIVILAIAAIIASLGYVKGTIELGQFIRERLFKK